MILAVCFNLYSQNKQRDSYGKLDDFGRETIATIVKKRIVRYGSDRPGHYYEMTVGFTVGEKMIRGPVQVTGGFYKKHVESDRVLIRYLPDNPKIREIDPAMRSQSSRKNHTIEWILVFIAFANLWMIDDNKKPQKLRKES